MNVSGRGPIRQRKEAEVLGKKIRREMNDEQRGWFSDISIDGRQFIQVQGPEGSIQLWAGVTTPEHSADKAS